MKKVLLCFVLFIILINNKSFSQQYCFWVANYSDESFVTLKLREAGEYSFGSDVLPNDIINPGEVFWIKTGTASNEVSDIQITKLDGTPLRFTWTGRDGNTYTESYITLNVKEIHTLVLTSDEYGKLSWDITYEDDYGFGHPCNQN
jgi:hypothetical protein